jgi:UDP-glucose 4-epimerase
MTILVTGGTGLVGTRLLTRLVEAGIDCRALVREGKTVPKGVVAFAGDILDPAMLVAAVQGVEASRASSSRMAWSRRPAGVRHVRLSARTSAGMAHGIDAIDHAVTLGTTAARSVWM